MAGTITVGTLLSDLTSSNKITIGSGTTLDLASGSAGTITLDAADLTGALPAISGASLTSIPAGNLTGALPAISGASLTNLPGGGNTPSFSAYHGSVQSISTNTWTKITIGSENWDTDSAFDSTTNYRFTVPSGEGGKYHLTAGIGFSRFDANITGHRSELRFYKNGSVTRGGMNTYVGDTASGYYQDPEYTTSLDIALAVGDYIEIYVWHYEGHSVNTSAAQTFFTGFKLAGV